MLIPLMGKRKRKNFPKVIKDLDFNQLSKYVVGVENEIAHQHEKFENVRWDKPNFSTEEVIIKYISIN